MDKKTSLRKQRWSYVSLLILVIYSTLYIVRPVATYLRKNIPSINLTANIIIVVLVIASLLKLCMMFKANAIKGYHTLALILAAIVLYGIIILKIELAEEKIHFFEYGILGLLAFRAFSIDLKGYKVYLFTFILASLIGWGDEGIQYLLPNRYYEIRDVVMNASGGAMALFLILIYDLDKRSLKVKPKGEI